MAQKRLDYEGIHTSNLVEHVTDSVISVGSDVGCSMSFAIDNQRLAIIAGSAKLSIMLECQRCKKPSPLHIHTTYYFSPVHSDKQTKALPEAYKPTEADEFSETDLLAMAENEIVPSLPVVLVHDSKHCKMSEVDMVFGELPDEAQKPDPFAILANLRHK